MNRIMKAAAVAGALVVLLAACSGGDKGETSEPEQTVGPLGEYFQKVIGDYDQTDADAQMRRAEEITAECMAEQGFEYVPQDYGNGSVVVVGGDDDLAWDSLEFAQQYGYGATTYEEMPGYSSGGGEEYVDPNQEYVDGMSESERNAYYEALYGVQPTANPENPDEPIEYDWTTAGCQGRGQYESSEVNRATEDEAFKALLEDLNNLYLGVEDDPRVAQIDVDWAECIRDAGYAFDTPSDAQQSIYDAMNELWEQAGENSKGEPDEAAMALLREVEIATAVADRTCQDEVDYTGRQMQIYYDLEQQFVDAHKAELDAWVAKYGQDG